MSALMQMFDDGDGMSTGAFLRWDAGDGRVWQLVDGQPQARAPASRTQVILRTELTILIGAHLRATHPNWSIVAEPGIVPRGLGRMNVRVPELAVAGSTYNEEQPTLADPILVIEILTSSNHRQVASNVWTYSSIPSVSEILEVETDSIRAHLLRRNADTFWPADPTELTSGDLALDSIGLRLPLAEIYRTTRLAGTAASG